jgi:hypothetical protein
VLEIFDVLDIEVVDAQPHAEILSFDRHRRLSPTSLFA